MSIDLHTHSTVSDGTLTPTELVREAAAAGLSAMALTDHDTVKGVPEALEAGKRFGIEVIPGCELSVTSPKGAGWLHIVGLWIPENPEKLEAAFEWVIEGRANRNHEIADRLRHLGVNIRYEDVVARATGTVGRPHFAQELMHLGVVSSINEAFHEWLGENGKAYVPKRKLSPEQAISVLLEEGATPILAHPFILGLQGDQMETAVRELVDLGLEGIEVHYTEHDSADTDRFMALAEKFNLLVSGGSDFHGTVKPDIKLGVGRGDLNVPDELLERMKAHRRAKGLPV
ncbi:PHP domain-containing protein [Pseudodesulfovibrio tunisiensis]|uniref:PHP domain-containing protein n=1 Tax=Pseudodesulfovibrio tunisiensis TaxID=463192 RepID=UPI001FB2FB40|nr:PHP domain-containing protein [Pseudodesulfovibrio tunisiensis]